MYLSGKPASGLPVLITPDTGYRVPATGPWAADSGCYANPNEYSDERYLAWLAGRRHAADRCLFATAPDVWGDAAATARRSAGMLQPIRELGYRVAYCLQDGATVASVPWQDIGAVFVGGSDAWRHGHGLPPLVAEALRRGLHVHIGRVNSRRRYLWARAIGAHSVDGTILRYDQTTPVAEWVAEAERQPTLW